MAKRKAAAAARSSASASARGRKKARKGSVRTASKKKARLRKASAGQARKASAGRARKKTAAKPARRASTAKTRVRKAARKPARTKRVAGQTRKAPALNRERRTIGDEGIVPTPPSSLDLDRTASAARSGRRELHEKLAKHTETSPALTGGDIDADWESAYAVGDEAPGGDNPTPDQDIVDDIGRAVGVEYEDNEELKGDKKIADRDKRRWELDPASAEDYDEH
jgi:hypothetical protein